MTRLSNLGFATAVALLATPAAWAAGDNPLFNTTYWATAVLVIFLAVVWRLGAFKAVGGMLDSRANNIQSELDHAKQLREEASAMLKDAERKQREASDHAEAIVRQAEADAKALMAQADKDLAEMVARREAQVETRIARAEEEATREVRKVAADAATKAAADIVRAQADKSNGADAFQSSLSQVKSAL